VCEACLVPLREDCRISVLKNRVLYRIFALTREEITGGCRNCRMSYLIFIFNFTFIKDDQVKEDGVSRACSVFGSDVKCI
jgi:hypothetical protein